VKLGFTFVRDDGRFKSRPCEKTCLNSVTPPAVPAFQPAARSIVLGERELRSAEASTIGSFGRLRGRRGKNKVPPTRGHGGSCRGTYTARESEDRALAIAWMTRRSIGRGCAGGARLRWERNIGFRGNA